MSITEALMKFSWSSLCLRAENFAPSSGTLATDLTFSAVAVLAFSTSKNTHGKRTLAHFMRIFVWIVCTGSYAPSQSKKKAVVFKLTSSRCLFKSMHNFLRPHFPYYGLFFNHWLDSTYCPLPTAVFFHEKPSTRPVSNCKLTQQTRCCCWLSAELINREGMK